MRLTVIAMLIDDLRLSRCFRLLLLWWLLLVIETARGVSHWIHSVSSAMHNSHPSKHTSVLRVSLYDGV